MTSTGKKPEFRLSLPSKTEYVSIAAGLVRQAVETLGGSGKACFEAALAVDEAVTNIIQHAYGGRPDGAIDLYFTGSKNSIEITIVHSGKQIEPDKLSLPDLDDHLKTKKTRGLGLAIILKLMDRVQYTVSEDDKAECRLFKKIKESAANPSRAKKSRRGAEKQVGE